MAFMELSERGRAAMAAHIGTDVHVQMVRRQERGSQTAEGDSAA